MKTAIILIFAGIICLLLAGNIRRESAKKPNSCIPIPTNDTVFVQKMGDAFYIIEVSILDVNNMPKENSQ